MTDPQTELVLEALVLVWPEGFATDPATGKGQCIETTLVVHKVLTALGVEHKPLPCQVWAANAAGLALADAKVPVEEWPEEAFSIGVDPDYTPPGPTRLDQWWGHLCVAGSDWLLDLTAEQFNRPQRGVLVEGGLLVTGLPVDLTQDTKRMLEANLRGGGTIRYISRNELARWRMSEAWRQDVAPQIIDMICSTLVDKLRERADG